METEDRRNPMSTLYGGGGQEGIDPHILMVRTMSDGFVRKLRRKDNYLA